MAKIRFCLCVLAFFQLVESHEFSCLCLSRELTALLRALWEPTG